MNQLSKVIAAVLVFGTAATPALADGYYGALDIGQTNAKDTCTGGPTGGCKDTSTAHRIAGGYQFTTMWGAEVSYGDYSRSTLGGTTGKWEANGLQASGTGTFPLVHAFSVIARAGIARTDLGSTVAGTPRSATSTTLGFGVGAQYDFSEGVAFRAQYENLGTVGNANTTGTTKISFVSVGAVLRF